MEWSWEPPEGRCEFNEEAGGLLDNLTERQLQASPEVSLNSGKRIGIDDFEQDDSFVAEKTKTLMKKTICKIH